jgi:hypothetical protein
MKRLHVLVEGQTEETFVRDVLTAHLAAFDVHPNPVLLKTKRVKSGGAFRGGVTSTEQVIGDVRRLLGDKGAAAVTTMIDYYALPDDFPGMSAFPSYRKTLHGPMAVGAIGLAALRAACPHAGAWLTRLEGL